jgi:hypothetical protein
VISCPFVDNYFPGLSQVEDCQSLQESAGDFPILEC